jgi:hypothetical protein
MNIYFQGREIKLKMYECKCGSKDFYVSKQKMHYGLYCIHCHRWIKWLNKIELRKAKYEGLKIIE